MKSRRLLTFILIAFVLGTARELVAEEFRGLRLVPDPVGQFFSLTREAEALAFHTDGTPDPSLCRHYQALVRVEAADGTPFFIVTRSGNRPDAVSGLPFDGGCIDGDGENGFGHLIVFRAGSRDKNGERLRSNRLSKLNFIDQTQPPPEDKATIFYSVTQDGLVLGNGPGGIPPHLFSHPGGMQVIGHTLALAVEEPCQDSQTLSAILCEPPTVSSMIQFYDVTDPEHPVLTSKFSPDAEMGGKAGFAGVTPMPDGRNLLVSAGGDGARFFFYRSNVAELSSPGLTWEPIGHIPGPTVTDPHQIMQFIRDLDGNMFLAGARSHPLKSDNDRIDLYSLSCDPDDCAPGAEIHMDEVVHGKEIRPFPTQFGSRLANLAAASTFYVSPSGELIFYAAGHDNNGPGKTLTMGEFRHGSVVRQDSPTLLPHADIDQSFEVEEGDSVTLTGAGRPPVTRAFIQLFKETDAGDLCTVVDFDDELLDDFDNIGRLCVFGSEDGIRSWGWYAPEGCTITASHTMLGGYKFLEGNGTIQFDFDLAQVQNELGTNDMFKRVDHIKFEGDCEAYYDTGVDLEWDLDRDGVFETTGTEVTFDSTGLDGPSVVSVPVQARHPESTQPGPGAAPVIVHNRTPVIEDIIVSDGAGNIVPFQVPFVLVGLPVTVTAVFSDPGIPDHQTAGIAWGDGASDPHTAFASFSDAFGGVIGHALARHVYTSPAEFQIIVTVTDDDGDAGLDSAKVKVLTVAQALEAGVGLLDDLIAGTSDADLRRALEKAYKALGGNPQARNGAREKLRQGNNAAAIAFLNQAITWLDRASGLGADAATLKAILQQMVLALGAAEPAHALPVSGKGAKKSPGTQAPRPADPPPSGSEDPAAGLPLLM